MWKPAEAIALTPTQRRQLEQIARHPRTTQKVALRVAIILGAAEGLSNRELARRLSTSRPTVLLWRRRFAEAGVDGLLRDEPRPGRRKQLSAQQVAQILEATLEQRPREATHWKPGPALPGQPHDGLSLLAGLWPPAPPRGEL